MDLKQQVEEQKQALLRIASQQYKKKKPIVEKDIEKNIKLNELWYQALLYKKEKGIITNNERNQLNRLIKNKRDEAIQREKFDELFKKLKSREYQRKYRKIYYANHREQIKEKERLRYHIKKQEKLDKQKEHSIIDNG